MLLRRLQCRPKKDQCVMEVVAEEGPTGILAPVKQAALARARAEVVALGQEENNIISGATK